MDIDEKGNLTSESTLVPTSLSQLPDDIETTANKIMDAWASSSQLCAKSSLSLQCSY